MSFRTVIVKDRAKLEYKLGYVIVRGSEEKRIHISEISTLIVETTGAAITAALMCELVKRNIAVIFCDEKHLPHFQLSPFANNYATSKNVKSQAVWQDDRKALAWTYIIHNKISMQAELLEKRGHKKESTLLREYIKELELGDETNREGHAAKVYFNALFGQAFSRREGHEEVNGKLNYGYAILLSAVSREIAAYGYITQLGIWHKNEFNCYNLASDIMEPFRVIVDDFVLSRLDAAKSLAVSMPQLLLTQIRVSNKEQYLDTAVKQYVRSVLSFMEHLSDTIIKIKEYSFSESEL